jgi:phosphatidylinositol-3-phosphatase
MGNWLRAALALILCSPAAAAQAVPRWDHVIVVVEENKDYDQIIGNPAAPFLNRLAAAGTTLDRMFGEEHPSQGNYFWLFAGSDMNVGFHDDVPAARLVAPNLGARLIEKGLGFKAYAEGLPASGSVVAYAPAGCFFSCLYGRKHAPWVSFANIPAASNLPFADFPGDYGALPTVAFVVPDLDDDMHNGRPARSIPAGDRWLEQYLGGYYRWALGHNGLLIVTFDENDDRTGYRGLTDPATAPDGGQRSRDLQNRIPTILAGAHVNRGYRDPTPLTHVNLLRTIEAAYGLPPSGAQQPNATRAGIADSPVDAAAFTP